VLYVVGIDVGTSGAKASLFCEDGTPVASGSDNYETKHPGMVQSEQDPEKWWIAVVNALKQISLKFPSLKDVKIAGISVSSQSPSLVALDKQGNVIRQAMIWMDRRAGAENERIVDHIVGIDRYREILGAEPDSFYTLPKLLWYKDHEPDNYKRTHMLLQANGYINYKLTGVFAIDTFQAINVQAMDRSAQTWSNELSGLLDIPFSSILPRIFKATDVIGSVSHEAAVATGLNEGIPVAAGTTDCMAAVFGMGLFAPGQSSDITGTSSLVCMACANVIKQSGSFQVKPSIFPGIGSYLVAPISSTGASFKWYTDTFADEGQAMAQASYDLMYEKMNLEASQANCGSGGLFFFPYMAGERAPLWNSYSRGMFIGLTLITTRKDIVRSIFEGTSYAVRHVYNEAKKHGVIPDTIYCSGGGSKSDIWLKIKSSVLDKELLVLDDGIDSSVRGNAFIAGVAGGIYTDIQKTSKEIVKVKIKVEPNPAWVKIYNDLYPHYLGLYSGLEPELRRLEKTVELFDTK